MSVPIEQLYNEFLNSLVIAPPQEETNQINRSQAKQKVEAGDKHVNSKEKYQAISYYQDALLLFKLIKEPAFDDLNCIFYCYDAILKCYAVINSRIALDNLDLEIDNITDDDDIDLSIEVVEQLISYVKQVLKPQKIHLKYLDQTLATAYEMLARLYEMAYNNYTNFNVVACLHNVADYYEAQQNIDPVILLMLYARIAIGYIRLKEKEKSLLYFDKALNNYFSQVIPTAESKKSVANVFHYIASLIMDEDLYPSHKKTLIKLMVAFPKMIKGLIEFKKYDVAILLCDYLINNHVNELLAASDLLSAASCYFLRGFCHHTLNKHDNALFDYQMAITYAQLSMDKGLQESNPEIVSILQAAYGYMHSVYQALTTKYDIINTAYATVYQFGADCFTQSKKTSHLLSSGLVDGDNAVETTCRLALLQNKLSHIAHYNSFFMPIVAEQLAKLLDFILKHSQYKVIPNLIFKSFITTPEQINKMKEFLVSLNKYSHVLCAPHATLFYHGARQGSINPSIQPTINRGQVNPIIQSILYGRSTLSG